MEESTGEVVNQHFAIIPEHTKITTPHDKDLINRIVKEQEEQKKKNRSNEPFIFIKKEFNLKDTPPAMATRFMFLITFMQYEGNMLRLNNRSAMTRNDIANVLNISPRNAVNFWESLPPGTLIEDADGHWHLESNSFKKGSLNLKTHCPYQRIFLNGMRRLYTNSNGKYLKQMGYLFKLLPFLNVEHNVLCWNPYEDDPDSLELISVADFSELSGYGLSNIDKLKQAYNDIRFPVGGHTELFCKIEYKKRSSNDAIICINPRILYSGSNEGKLRILEKYFCDS